MVVAVHPHNPKNFTQGLIAEGDILFESCGLYGQSQIIKTNLKSGQIIQEVSIPEDYFAEGIAMIGNQLIQLTWKEKKALIYDAKTLELTKEIPYRGEGWGLCQDGNFVWMSNGTSELHKRDPATFEIVKTLSVKQGKSSIGFLNDLICVENSIYANMWGQDNILRIDKQTGQVTGIIDTSSLLTKKQKAGLPMGAVLNGLAYRKESETFFVTGKYWPSIFEVRFEVGR